MNCPSCGSPNSEDAQYCNLCLHSFAEHPAELYPLEPASPDNTNVQSEPRQTVIDNNVYQRSWFERHLNLTFVLSDFVAYAAISAIANFHCFINGMPLSFFLDEVAACPAYVHILAWVFGLAATFGMGSWVLMKKNRSIAWLLLLFTGPIGIITFLFLTNMNPAKDTMPDISVFSPAGTKALSR